MTNGHKELNGNGRSVRNPDDKVGAWGWFIRLSMFATPLLITFVGFYVGANDEKTQHETLQIVEDKYLAQDNFDNWVKWQYNTDRDVFIEKLDNIADAVEAHDEETR